MKFLIILLITVFMFFGCSSDLSSTKSSATKVGCSDDIYGLYGTCISFGDEDLLGTWTIWDGNVSNQPDGNMTASIQFLSNGVAIYLCNESNCNSNDNYIWRIYNEVNATGEISENNLTILNSLDGTLYENYEYQYKNNLDEKVFLRNSNQLKSFIKL